MCNRFATHGIQQTSPPILCGGAGRHFESRWHLVHMMRRSMFIPLPWCSLRSLHPRILSMMFETTRSWSWSNLGFCMGKHSLNYMYYLFSTNLQPLLCQQLPAFPWLILSEKKLKGNNQRAKSFRHFFTLSTLLHTFSHFFRIFPPGLFLKLGLFL